jgi:hypothetical protein
MARQRRPCSGIKLLTAVALSLAGVPEDIAHAQTVGPERLIRDPALAGAVYDDVTTFHAGEAFAAWLDTRNDESGAGFDGDIYVQKVGADGIPAWTTNGFPASMFFQDQRTPAIAPDGTGGAVVAWVDQRGIGARYIFGQRVSSAGEGLWTTDGIQLGDMEWGEQYTPSLHLAPDGNFLFSYGETRGSFPTTYWIVAQKIDANGQRLWGDNGVDTVEGVRSVRSLHDGSGGLVVFGQLRDEPLGFRFQRVRADESLAWPSPVDIEAEPPFSPLFDFTTDGSGGIILAFLDAGVVRAVRVSGAGELPWAHASTVLADLNVVTSEPPAVASDGAGGAFVAWISSSPRDVHVLHITSDGTHLWPEGGAVVPDGSGTERETTLVSDEAGGIYVSFATSTSLRGQRLDRDGVAQWKVNGSNGVSLMTGFEPEIGFRLTGPLVVYRRSFGLSSRIIDVPPPVLLTLENVAYLPTGEFSFTLTGGVPETLYDILRTSTLGSPVQGGAWENVGSIRPGETWIDVAPPQPTAVYIAVEPAP